MSDPTIANARANLSPRRAKRSGPASRVCASRARLTKYCCSLLSECLSLHWNRSSPSSSMLSTTLPLRLSAVTVLPDNSIVPQLNVY